MRRIDSGLNFTEARKVLRERFIRFLPVNQDGRVDSRFEPTPPLSDRELVVFLQRLEIQSGADLECARLAYEATRLEQQIGEQSPLTATENTRSERTENETITTTRDGKISVRIRVSGGQYSFEGLNPVPTFNEMLDAGWILQSWNRFSVPRTIHYELLRHTEECTKALRTIDLKRNEHLYSTSTAGLQQDVRVRDLLYEVEEGTYVPLSISCVAPGWVLARLWDTPENEDISDDDARFSRWLDRRSCFRHPQFSAYKYLRDEHLATFVETAKRVLEYPTSTPNWPEFEAQVGRPEALLKSGGAFRSLETETLKRAYWLKRGLPEHTFHDHIETRGAAVVGLLLRSLSDSPFDSCHIGPWLMKVGVQRPVVLGMIDAHARTCPAILADMLLAKETCTFACSIIASWHFHDAGWFNEFQAPANSVTNLLAFDDALAVLGAHLENDEIPACEMASLYEYVFKLTQGPRNVSRSRESLALLREELMSTSGAYYDSVVLELINETHKSNFTLTTFCAALDLAADDVCLERIEPKSIVGCYLDVILFRDVYLSRQMLDVNGAHALCALAIRAGGELWERFAGILDIEKWRLEHEQSSQPNVIDFSWDACARIRHHARLLARAIAGWPTKPPEKLVEALAQAIEIGATDRPDRNQFAAFSPAMGFGDNSSQEPSIAKDFAAALMRLPKECVEILVSSICQIDEPAILAGIVAETSELIHQPIKKRINALRPASTQAVYSISALNARIDALLNAEMVEAAIPFVESLRSVETLGPVQGRELDLLRTELRVQFLQKDWKGLAARTPNRNDYDMELRRQYEIINFFQAVAEMSNPNGDIAVAEAKFKELETLNRTSTAYPLNLFAARVHRILRTDSLQILRGDSLAEARRFLLGAGKYLVPRVKLDKKQSRILDFNRAVLYLAAGQPSQTLNLLNSLCDEHPMENVEGFRALAIARISSVDEAKTILMAAERQFGRTEFLAGIRANIDEKRPFFTAPHLSIDENPLPGIRHAIAQFHRLGHVDQAQILHSRGNLHQYLMEEVREACASLTGLVPMMQNLAVVSENDISGVLKQLLRSRLVFPQWAVEDQSRGGWSERGGAGNRDLVISKGTAELAVIEALKVGSVEKGPLSSHFRKLLGYSECSNFFHVTYVMNSNCAGVLNFLKDACRNPPHPEIHLVRIDDLPKVDSCPIGFEAYYTIGERKCYVVFLALDMEQMVQKKAAQIQRAKP